MYPEKEIGNFRFIYEIRVSNDSRETELFQRSPLDDSQVSP